MNDSLSKLRESMHGRQGANLTEGGVGLGRGNQARGQRRGGTAKGNAGRKRNFVLPILLVVMGCAVFLFAAWSAVNSPVLASILSLSSASQQDTRPPGGSFAQVTIAKPTYTPVALAQEFTLEPPVLPTATLTQPAPAEVVIPPTEIPTLEAEVAAQPEETTEAVVESEAVAVAEIVADTPTPQYVAPTAAPNSPPPPKVGSGERWIDVNLSEQRLYAYEGDTLVHSFVVSTGTWRTPTVTGSYKIWIKLRSSSMSGPGYYLPDVPFIMYFYKGYGIHGTYWHNNFGTPMSRGCVNMTIADAEWVYNFVSVGTVVNVHY